MKSADEILRAISSLCPKFPDPKCFGCICDADIAAVRAAQIDAAEWMREEAARKATGFLVGDPFNGVPLHSPAPHQIADAIRAIKLPGNDADPI